MTDILTGTWDFFVGIDKWVQGYTEPINQMFMPSNIASNVISGIADAAVGTVDKVADEVLKGSNIGTLAIIAIGAVVLLRK